jgi:hypothetical protein
MSIRQWITDDRYAAIDPIAWLTLLRASGHLPTASALGFAVWLFGDSGANVQWVIYFHLRNTGCE